MNKVLPVPSPVGAGDFLKGCLCVDLEATMDGRILHTGAVLDRETVEAKGGLGKIELELERLAAKAAFLLGHNIIEHDLPVLQTRARHLDALFRLPVIDTLFLSPIAYPENPYHHLVKDYKLVRASVNDPVADARLAAEVFTTQWQQFEKLNGEAPEVMSFFRYCFEAGEFFGKTGLGLLFEILGAKKIDAPGAQEIFEKIASRHACRTSVREIAATIGVGTPPSPALPYAFAWLRVAGSRSVLPPWVRHRFQDVPVLLHRLRDLPCSAPDCTYCNQTHDPRTQLKRFFGLDSFRPEPATKNGKSLQEEVVAHGMRDEPLLAILPTGAGKSLCFQIPALARNFRRGVLTVVISPLQALMKDQVDNLTEKTGTPFAGAIYGMLTPPERGAMLESIRLGDIAILYISPEQLRNQSVREVLSQREIGSWVFDEAHCFSKWGHDFRPDYHYASRFIREFAEQQRQPIPPVACFTATAKTDVREEIIEHFRRELDQELVVYNGGADRHNLDFEVQNVNASQKWERAHEILFQRLPDASRGSAVLYTATQKGAEDAARYLKAKDWPVEAYHAGLSTPEKRRILEAFISGEVPIICATNAFGMGIDKDNVRVVIHLDIPGSLENYLQEAGRAGRDRLTAECILLFDEQDIETQFKLGALSRLTRKDIAQILRGLRSAKRNREGELVVTTGEILRSDQVELEFHHGDRSADTKVRTAIAVLEKTGFIERNQNQTRVFQGSPLVKDLDDASAKMAALKISPTRQTQWLAVLSLLINSKSNEMVSADTIAELPEFAYGEKPEPNANATESDSTHILKTLNEMAEAGLIKKDLLLTAFVRHKVVNPSWQILERVCALESAMIALLRQEEPDPEGWMFLSMARLNQQLLDAGHQCLPQTLLNILKSIARDGKGMAGRQGSIELKYHSQGQQRVKIQRNWEDLIATARKRQDLAKLTLNLLLSKIPAEAPGRADTHVEFSEGDLNEALDQDFILKQEIRNRTAAFEHALMFLHDQHVIVLQQGLAIFRQAMTIRLLPDAHERRFTQGDFSLLDQHYQERIFQVHVMHEYARLGLDKIQRAIDFVRTYFTCDKDQFLQLHFSGKKEVLKRATGAESYRRIVDSLNNPVQAAVVSAKPDENMLILAGPGSGKTRVVAHRCAYLLRVERVPARGILVLCFNRNAASNLRRRIYELAGDDARGVTIQTYHSLALRLTGNSFSEEAERNGSFDLKTIIPKAVDLLRGKTDIPGAEPDELRDRLLEGYRQILVDEYQDIDGDQYELVSAIAGRTLADPDSKLSILAVGDDDQNIYSFRGANVQFIRRFESDYHSKNHYLVENYRSTRHIIEASNSLIIHNKERMKTDQPIRPDKARSRDAAGGRWQALDPIGNGKVLVIEIEDAHQQAAAMLTELRRLKSLCPDLQWRNCAILARTRDELMPIRAALDHAGIPLSWGPDRDKLPALSRIREVAQWLDFLKANRHELRTASALWPEWERLAPASPSNPWWRLVRDLTLEWQEESSDAEQPLSAALEFFYESLHQRRREPVFGEGVFLSTVHSAKGLEFEHVFIPGGGWQHSNGADTQEEERRLYYVAMTRAKETLTLFERADDRNPHSRLLNGEYALRFKPSRSEDLPHEATHLRYDLLSLEGVFLDFAGRKNENDEIHLALATLRPGSSLSASMTAHGHIELSTPSGVAVARLSSNARAQWADKLEKVVRVNVVAMIRRTIADVTPEYVERCLCKEWEVPVVEIQWQ